MVTVINSPVTFEKGKEGFLKPQAHRFSKIYMTLETSRCYVIIRAPRQLARSSTTRNIHFSAASWNTTKTTLCKCNRICRGYSTIYASLSARVCTRGVGVAMGRALNLSEPRVCSPAASLFSVPHFHFQPPKITCLLHYRFNGPLISFRILPQKSSNFSHQRFLLTNFRW